MPEWLTRENIISVVTAVVTLAAAIAAITPSNSDNKVIQKILDVVNLLGINIGAAKNADDRR
jgi:hypothetical protein